MILHFIISVLLVFGVYCSQADVRPPGGYFNQSVDRTSSQSDKKSLKDTCSTDNLKNHIDFLSDQSVSIYKRKFFLYSILESCGSNKNLADFFRSVVYHDHIEWILKKVIIEQVNHRCNKKIVDYLLQQLRQSTIDHYRREDFIWSLSDFLQEKPITTENNCSEQIVSSFSKLIQTDQSYLTPEFMDFRTQKILPLLLSMVRLGIRNQISLVGQELKTIALNHNVNDHFRAMAVEALQGFGAYSVFGVDGLYQVIKDITVRLSKKTYLEMTDSELVRNQKDNKIRQYALTSLEELANGSYFSFLDGIVGNREHLDAHTHQFYWRRVLLDLPPPKDNSHILNVLKKSSDDSIVNDCCGIFFKNLLQ